MLGVQIVHEAKDKWGSESRLQVCSEIKRRPKEGAKEEVSPVSQLSLPFLLPLSDAFVAESLLPLDKHHCS